MNADEHGCTYVYDSVPLNGWVGRTNGGPLVMLHGVLRNGGCFAPLLAGLGARHEVHALDLRGHGRSRAGSGYRVVDYVPDVLRYLRTEVCGPAVLYGHSLGAMVSAAVAAAEPRLVKAIVMEDPPFHTMGERMKGTALQDYFEMIARFAGSCLPVDELALVLAENWVGPPREATTLRFLASSLRQVRPEVLAPIVAGEWLDGYPMDAVFRAVRCPALLMQCDGAVGGMLTDEDACAFVELARDCTLSVLRGVGHQAHWMATGEVLRRTLEFVGSLEGSR
ncbi:MAG: alpha/beta hydrolase [Acidobacteria bacterium]|nr:alpha/beta hydrolase [Acidobacteriota bacterium]